MRDAEGNETTSLQYYHSDHLGSANILTDATGAQTAHYEYEPYGETSIAEVTSGLGTSYKFTGKEQDATTGLYFYAWRYYDPYLGRFTQPDTIIPSPTNPQSFNRYSYTDNNPINYTDPTGHKKFRDFFKKFGDYFSPFGRAVVTGDWKHFGIVVATMALNVMLPGSGTLSSNFLLNVGLHAARGAAIGAITGGVSSSIMGGDFWQGAKLGATVGAISGGVQGIATSEQFGNFMNGNGFRSNASVRAEQIRIANLRDSLTTSKSELVSATRTTQAAESGVADMMGAELMMSNFQGDSGSALQNFALRHVGLKATFNAGLGGIGVSGQVSFTSAGIYGRVGLGPGIGWGATLTTGTSFGSSSGWGITGSLAGGSGYAGGVLSGTISQGGSKLYIGGGLGDFAVGGSASLTGGYEGEIITW